VAVTGQDNPDANSQNDGGHAATSRARSVGADDPPWWPRPGRARPPLS